MQRKKHPKNVQLAYIQFKEETINFHLFLMTSYFRKLNTDWPIKSTTNKKSMKFNTFGSGKSLLQKLQVFSNKLATNYL